MDLEWCKEAWSDQVVISSDSYVVKITFRLYRGGE